MFTLVMVVLVPIMFRGSKRSMNFFGRRRGYTDLLSTSTVRQSALSYAILGRFTG